jgi:hypothetical protein
MAKCNCQLCRETCNCEHSADLIDRLNNVKTDVNDYFVIVDAVNAITALRNRSKELSEDIGLQRDDAWDDGFAHGYSRGEDEGQKTGYKNGYDTALKEKQ